MSNQVYGMVEAQQEVLRKRAGIWPGAPARRAVVPEPPSKPADDRSSRVSGLTRPELEELREALGAYENAEGDWSKSR